MPFDPEEFAPKRKSFVERVKAPRASEIVLVRGNDTTGRAAWYYFRKDERKKSAFDRRAKREQLNLSEFGTILISGYGKDPPPETVEHMRVEYGFVGSD